LYDRDPRPKCPKCGSFLIVITGANYINGTLKVKCINCNYSFEIVHDVWM